MDDHYGPNDPEEGDSLSDFEDAIDSEIDGEEDDGNDSGDSGDDGDEE